MTTTREQSHRRRPRMTHTAIKSARLAARLSPTQKQVVERAAALNHQPVSQFLVMSAMRVAEEIIKQHDIMTLSARDSLTVMEALLHPEPAGPKLRRTVERYHAFMSEQ